MRVLGDTLRLPPFMEENPQNIICMLPVEGFQGEDEDGGAEKLEYVQFIGFPCQHAASL